MSILKDSFYAVFNRIYRTIISLVFVVLISRFLSPEQYGSYRQAILISSLLSLLLLFGLPDTIGYYYSILSYNEKNKLISTSIIIEASTSIILAVLLFALKDSISIYMNNPKLRECMFCTAVLTVAYSLSGVLDNYYAAAGYTVLSGKMNTILYTVYYVTAAVIIYLYRDVYLQLVLLTGFEVFKTVLMYLIIFKSEKFRFVFDKKYFKNILIFTSPLALSSIIITMNREIDKVIVSGKFSTESFALYSNATLTPPLLELITVCVSIVVFPKLSQLYSEGGFKESLKLWRQVTTNTAILLYPIVVLLLLFSENYITFLFSEKYISGSLVLSVYMLRQITTITIFSNLLILLEQKNKIFRNSLIGLGVNLVLNIALINTIGMVGSAVAVIVSQYLINFLEIKQILKYGNVQIEEMLDIKSLVLTLAIPSAAGILLYLISLKLDAGKVYNLFIYGGCLMIITFLAYIRIGLIKKSFLVNVHNRFFNYRGRRFSK